MQEHKFVLKCFAVGDVDKGKTFYALVEIQTPHRAIDLAHAALEKLRTEIDVEFIALGTESVEFIRADEELPWGDSSESWLRVETFDWVLEREHERQGRGGLVNVDADGVFFSAYLGGIDFTTATIPWSVLNDE